MYSVKSAVIQITPIHDVESTWFENQLVQEIDIVNLCGSYNYNAGNVPFQIQQGVELDSALGLTKFCPRKQGEAEVDGCGIQCEGGLNKFDAQAFPRIKILSLLDENLGKVPKNPPIPALVGIGQCASGDLAPNSCVIELSLQGVQAGYDVPQTFSESQLGKDHDYELSIAAERSNSPVPLISRDALVELVSRQEIQQLRKNSSSIVHFSTPSPLSGMEKLAGGIFPFQIEKSFLPRRYIYS